MYLQDVFTVPITCLVIHLYQFCAQYKDGPVGAQLIGKKLSDQTLLEYGNFILKIMYKLFFHIVFFFAFVK